MRRTFKLVFNANWIMAIDPQVAGDVVLDALVASPMAPGTRVGVLEFDWAERSGGGPIQVGACPWRFRPLGPGGIFPP